MKRENVWRTAKYKRRTHCGRCGVSELGAPKAKEARATQVWTPKEKLDERKADLSQSLRAAVKTYEKWSGARGGRMEGRETPHPAYAGLSSARRRATYFKARFVTGFFKTEEAYVSEDEESFEPALRSRLCDHTKSVAAV